MGSSGAPSPDRERVAATPADAAPAGRRALRDAVVQALLDNVPDHATTRFDHEVRAAVAGGQLDPTLAATLRWWQQASVRAAGRYVATALPAALTADDEAAAAARADFDADDAAWERAQHLSGQLDRPLPRGDAAPPSVPAGEPRNLGARTTLRLVPQPVAARTGPRSGIADAAECVSVDEHADAPQRDTTELPLAHYPRQIRPGKERRARANAAPSS